MLTLKLVAGFFLVAVPTAFALNRTPKIQPMTFNHSSDRLYSCTAKMTFFENGQEAPTIERAFVADGQVGEKGQFVASAEFKGVTFLIEVWSFNSTGLSFSFYAKRAFSLGAVGWGTTAPSEQHVLADGEISPNRIISPFEIEDQMRDLDEGLQLKTKLECARLPSSRKAR